MTSPDVPESDWQVFRELREVALDRYCERALARVEELCAGSSEDAHDRYLRVSRFLRDRDESLSRMFDDPRRSRMLVQLAALHADDLLEPEELDRFTQETRDRIELLVG